MSESIDENLNVAFVGHVNHGKSTCLGHLLYNLNAIDKREVEKNTSWSCILDQDESERATGNTHTFNKVCSVYKNKNITFIDTPGHKILIQEMISGANRCRYFDCIH
jgi:translation elongation factor EF-1alpha